VSLSESLRALGDLIRLTRTANGLTQQALGERAGLGGKYVSEIERGTRDLPFSTLHALVEHGLGLRLEISFPRSASRASAHPPLPRAIEELARKLATLSRERQRAVVALVKVVLRLASG
jgi:transcriptional regulator with XRE-family HTH domain